MALLLLLVAALLLQPVLHLLQELQEMRLLVLLKISALVEERLQRLPLRDAKAEDDNQNYHILKTRFSSEAVVSLHQDEGLNAQNTEVVIFE